jgi:hypothetical protein
MLWTGTLMATMTSTIQCLLLTQTAQRLEVAANVQIWQVCKYIPYVKFHKEIQRKVKFSTVRDL